MTEEFCEVVITASDPAWLLEFTRSLVSDRLAACGQNVSPIRSIFRWEGQIEDEGESRVALHTRTSLVPEIVKRTDSEHPYDVPCVIAMPIVAGNPMYLAWIADETRDPCADNPRPAQTVRPAL